MKILAILTPSAAANLTSMGALRVKEERVLWPLYTSGVVREMYFDDDPIRITFVMEAASLAEAHRHLSTLPLVEAGLLQIDSYPLKPWLPLENLFAPESEESN